MKLTVDNQQRIITGGLFFIELFRIIMGTCLSVFVPHMCDKDEICSVAYNIKDNRTNIHLAALAFNAISLLTFLTLYGFETRRENWCIKYLDIDKTKSPINLDHEIEAYPEIKLEMHKLNKNYKRITIICAGVQIVNISMSVADIAIAWAGFASLTPLLSYVMLIVLKLQSSYSISAKSLLKERALSAYMKHPKIFNTIDADFKKPLEILYTNETYKH